tara:strand:+ start:967 stop:1356 length:390 start_codon:yes stop_codon:yes gene_type:complete
MIKTTSDFTAQAINSLIGNLPGAFIMRGGNFYNNVVWNTDIVTDIPTEQQVVEKSQELYNNEAMNILRKERDRLLVECDWVVIKARETNTNVPAAWKTYRQALRDLPSTASPELDGPFIQNVNWPTPPA